MTLLNGLTHHYPYSTTSDLFANESTTPVEPLFMQANDVGQPGPEALIQPGKIGPNAQFYANFPSLSQVQAATPPAINQFAAIPSGASVAFTIAVWVSFRNLNGSPFGLPQYAFSQGTGSGGLTNGMIHFGARGESSDQGFLYVQQSDLTDVVVEGSTAGPLNTGVYHFLLGWLDPVGGVLGINVNGQENTIAHDGSIANVTPVYPLLGRAHNVNSGHLDGTMDELAIWNRVLTPAERSQLYNGGAGVDLLDLGGGDGGGGTLTRRRRR